MSLIELFGRGGADRDHLAAGVDHEVGRPRAVEQAAHHRQAVMPHRQRKLRRLLRQRPGQRQLVRGVVDGHRQAETERREAFSFPLRDAAQRRGLDQRRHVADLERADLERVEPPQLQAAQAHLADAGAQRVGNRTHHRARRGLPGDGGELGAGVEHEVLRAAAVDARLDDDLLVDDAEIQGVNLVAGGFVDARSARARRTSAGSESANATTPPFRCDPCWAGG